MKKLLFSVVAFATLLFAASCQQENLEPVAGDGTVTYSVQMPGAIATKAVGDDLAADYELIYEVYRAGEIDVLDAEPLYEGTTSFNGNVATVQLQFVKRQEYKVLFWAQADTLTLFNTTDLREVSMNSSWKGNDLATAVFAGTDSVTDCVSAKKGNVTLVRPVSQINIATSNESLTVGGAEVGQTSQAITMSKVTVAVKGLHTVYNVYNKEVSQAVQNLEFSEAEISKLPVDFNSEYKYVAMNYVGFAPKDGTTVDVDFSFVTSEGSINHEVANVPIKANYRTNILGNLITEQNEYTVTIDTSWDAEYNVQGDEVKTNTYVSTAYEFAEAFAAAFAGEEDNNMITLDGNINLNDLLQVRSVVPDPSYTLPAGKTLTLDLNGNTLSATSAQTGKNYNMFDVRGTLTVKNGTIEYEHVGENMGWGSSTNIFNVTAGGVLNLEGLTAKNLGGSDMGFVAHLNNWGEVTLNVKNCTLESNYVPVRVFNSGYDMNNVDIKESTLNGVSAAFWVHNYTAEDFGSEAKAEAQKALLNVKIYGQDNKFTPDINGIRYGFTNSIRTDAYGITKTVSEDGTQVTLGSLVENGLIRRGVAGAEENRTITKVVVEEGVGVLYDRTFRRFYALEEVILPSTLTTIGAAGSGVFQSCSNLKKIVLPESVTVLGKGTFQECTSLESINIPAGVTRIESDALRNTGLKSVEFHAGVTYFGAQAFRDCKQLTKVVINAPEFTMEGNTFGIMAAPYTPMTIEVANAEMKAYVESNLTAHAKTYITVVAPEVATNVADLQANLAEGKNVVLANDVTITDSEAITAPYGNKTALSQNGGVFDGNDNTITSTLAGDSYIYMTNGGTTKNVNITGAFRGIMIMSPTQTVYLENVVSGGKGVVYAFNTGEGDSTQDVVATNCTFNGWCSWSEIKSATFTNCTFGQGSEYSNVIGRIGRPYVNTLFEGCAFCSKYYIDLSGLKADQKVIVKNCTVNGVKITAENWTSLVAPEDTCGDGQISVELKGGSFLTAENVADYIVFE